MEAGKTLTNEEVIRELLDLLKKNAMKEQANDVFVVLHEDTEVLDDVIVIYYFYSECRLRRR